MEQTSRLMTLASNVKLFNGIPMHLLGQMISFADKVEIMEGLTYFNEGDTGDSFYILIIGHVVVEQQKSGKWVQLAALHPGDSFGEMILVDDKVRSARVRATSDSTALYFPLQRLKASPEILSSLYFNIAKVLVKRLKSTNNVVMELHQKAREDARGGLPPPSPELIEAMKKPGDDFVSYEKDENAEDPKAAPAAAKAAAPRPDDTPAHFVKRIKPMADLEFDMGSSVDPLPGLAVKSDGDAEAGEGGDGGEASPAKAAAASASSVIIPELNLRPKKGIGPY
jgi:CRP/FNR family cyclic AMP-dependent transcriptional regulator